MIWAIVGHWEPARFIRAEAPCWKGEVRLGWLTIGWSRGLTRRQRRA